MFELDGKLGIWEVGEVKTTLEIPDELFRKAKAMAVLEGVKLKDFVAEGLQMRVEMKGQAARATKPRAARPTLHDRFRKYCGVVKSGVGDLSSNPKHMEGFGED